MTTPSTRSMAESVPQSRESSSDWRETRKQLQRWREDGGRESDKVVRFGVDLIKQHGSKLGEEVWTVREQVAMAALDVGDDQTAEEYLNVLSRQFPDSARIKRLRGMQLESKQCYDEATTLYLEHIESSPTELVMRKRLVAISKAQGDTVEAVNQLNQIVDNFMADFESWRELADLYISLHIYDKAAFCLEELLLSNPHNYIYHQRYAEVCYTQGTPESLELSCKHFATALKLNPESLRAVYGMHKVAVDLSTHPKMKAKEFRIKYSKMADWAQDQLKQRYQGHKCCRVVEKYLDSVHSSR